MLMHRLTTPLNLILVRLLPGPTYRVGSLAVRKVIPGSVILPRFRPRGRHG